LIGSEYGHQFFSVGFLFCCPFFSVSFHFFEVGFKYSDYFFHYSVFNRYSQSRTKSTRMGFLPKTMHIDLTYQQEECKSNTI
jgi:hypothetical protein